MAERSRITICTTAECAGVLEEIRLATGRPNNSEVVRDALEFYDLVVQYARQGKRIFIGDSRESAGEVLLPQLIRAQISRSLELVEDIVKGKKP